MSDYLVSDLRLLRQAHGLRQADVAASMVPPVVRQRVAQLERRRRLSPEQFRRVAAAILAASR
jgi:transcriptional regulator with XRE-family HTH domain